MIKALRKFLVGLAVVLIAFAGPTAISATAQAAVPASCTAGGVTSETSPVASSSFSYNLCNNNMTVSGGVLHDTSCDNRAAEVYFGIEVHFNSGWLYVGTGPIDYPVTSKSYKVSTGCGQSASYPSFTLPNGLSSPGDDCATCQHRLRIHLYSCNTLGCSSDYVYTVDTYYYQ
ncbi:MAG TPA: hypothetical protein VFI65_29960 [Streptosporangiaceae bacterium]|nr:hypothetical protein [Streptosporangiaceae bacterium]